MVLQQRVRTLQAQVTKLDASQKPHEDQPAIPQMRGPDMTKLNKITLPRHPTKEQLKQYVSRISTASAGQDTMSSNDPQVGMLAKVGAEHMDALIDALSGAMGGGDSSRFDRYLLTAISHLASADAKKTIISHLADQRQLIEIVVSKGWEKDAKKPLVKVLNAHPWALPPGWVRAVARLQDKSTYAALKRYFVTGPNPIQTFHQIEYLPGIKLSDAVARAWRRVEQNPSPWQRLPMAQIAVRYGQKDALTMLIDKLPEGNSQAPGGLTGMFGQSMRGIVLRHIKFRGTNKQIKAWYKKHQASLHFDPESEKFTVGHSLSRLPTATVCGAGACVSAAC